MTNLPRLELTENPDKKSDFIIFRKSSLEKRTKKNTKKWRRKTRKHRKKGLFKFYNLKLIMN